MFEKKKLNALDYYKSRYKVKGCNFPTTSAAAQNKIAISY